MTAKDLNRPMNILIVDDNEHNLATLSAVLESPDYHIMCASSGAEALRCLLRDEFAVMLLDVKMPDMDGFECARLVKGDPRVAGMPIIFLSAVATDLEFIFKGYSTGGVDYIVKPFEPAVVKAKVAIFVELYRGRKAMQWQLNELRKLSECLQREIDEKKSVLDSVRFAGRRPSHPPSSQIWGERN